jgi:hypothetical protein
LNAIRRLAQARVTRSFFALRISEMRAFPATRNARSLTGRAFTPLARRSEAWARCRAPSSAAGKDVVKLKLGEGSVTYWKKAVRSAMLEEYAESYQRIADALKPGLPKGWTEVFVLAEMRTSEGMVSGFARTKAPEPEWFEVPMPAYDAFRAMYVVVRDSGDPKALWTSATLHLKRDGTFQVDYAYDPVPVEDQFDRIAAWAQSHGAASP